LDNIADLRPIVQFNFQGERGFPLKNQNHVSNCTR